MMLTTQEVAVGAERAELEAMIKAGLKYNVCSMTQFQLIADFAKKNNIDLSMRVHPGAACRPRPSPHSDADAGP